MPFVVTVIALKRGRTGGKKRFPIVFSHDSVKMNTVTLKNGFRTLSRCDLKLPLSEVDHSLRGEKEEWHDNVSCITQKGLLSLSLPYVTVLGKILVR